jgi:hypothetical protein
MGSDRGRIRLGAGALVVAAVLFVLYPAVRPWEDESTVDGATRAMSSGAWVASHLFAMIGFILIPLGLLALWGVVAQSRAEPLGFAALIVTWVGAGLTLPYYGGEAFALNAIATQAKDGQSLDLLELVDAFRFHPVGATTFVLGLLLLGIGAIMVAVTIWRSAVLPRLSGIPFALGMALFIPQFYAPAAVRIAHGVLVAAGLIWIAIGLWRSDSREVTGSPAHSHVAR